MQSPPLRRLRAPFLEGPRAWLVLARNAVPVLGVYALGWSSRVAVFEIWFDGVTALAAMLALHLRAFVRTEPKAKVPPDIAAALGPTGPWVLFAVVWALLFALLGIPYWFGVLWLWRVAFDGLLASGALADPLTLAALAAVLVSNTVEELQRGYERMSADEVRREFNWDFSMQLARIAAVLTIAFLPPRYLILGIALVLSYVEIYPMRALRILGGDHTLEPGNETRSRD